MKSYNIDRLSKEELFGGKWTQIKGRFLFSSDNNHPVGSTGGEEMHTLNINEMPSHNHNYDRFYYDNYFHENLTHNGNDINIAMNYNNNYGKYTTSTYTGYQGGTQPHNNMPPYITANCWRRES